jgi:hypothetical protein
MMDLRLLACVVLSVLVVCAIAGPPEKGRLFLHAGVTSVIDESPVNQAATQVGCPGEQQTGSGSNLV